MVIARIESLIAGKSVEHALDRAEAYISAGVDGIMIHSKNKTPTKLIEFCKEYQRFNYRVPLVVVPTTYNHIKENELHQLGANIIIYANHLLRSSHKNMVKVCNNILENECSFNCQHLCSDVKELLELTEDKI
jgi:phosphoenolpyruvate phosphomutase